MGKANYLPARLSGASTFLGSRPVGGLCQGRAWASGSPACFPLADVNECEVGMHHCSEGQLCHNLPGSYRCDCKAGFQRDAFGRACVGRWGLVAGTPDLPQAPSRLAVKPSPSSACPFLCLALTQARALSGLDCLPDTRPAVILCFCLVSLDSVPDTLLSCPFLCLSISLSLGLTPPFCTLAAAGLSASPFSVQVSPCLFWVSESLSPCSPSPLGWRGLAPPTLCLPPTCRCE